MKSTTKTHWLRTTLLVLVICGVVGVILAAISFFGNPEKTTVSTSITFAFEGAADGLAPNGNYFDPDELTSDEVLNAALESAGLTGQYTPDQIRQHLAVTGNYPEKLLEKVSKYSSLLDMADNQELAITNYRPTNYSVVLDSGLDTSLSQSAQTALLEAIVNAYRNYFTRTYSENLDTSFPVFELSNYDYPQQLNLMTLSLQQIARFADELYERKPTFTVGGVGFNDISLRLTNVIDSDISRLNANVTMNVLTKDAARLLTVYQYEIQDLRNQLTYQEERQNQLDSLIAAYKKNAIIYLSTSDNVTRIAGDNNVTYDKLVDLRKEVAKQIAEINSNILYYQLRTTDITGKDESEESGSESSVVISDAEEASENELPPADMTEEEIAAAAAAAQEATLRQSAALERSIAQLNTRIDTILADFQKLLDAYNAQEINDGTVAVSSYRYYAPKLLSGSFIRQAVKSAGPLCAVGFMVCLLLMIIQRRRGKA